MVARGNSAAASNGQAFRLRSMAASISGCSFWRGRCRTKSTTDWIQVQRTRMAHTEAQAPKIRGAKQGLDVLQAIMAGMAATLLESLMLRLASRSSSSCTTRMASGGNLVKSAPRRRPIGRSDSYRWSAARATHRRGYARPGRETCFRAADGHPARARAASTHQKPALWRVSIVFVAGVAEANHQANRKGTGAHSQVRRLI